MNAAIKAMLIFSALLVSMSMANAAEPRYAAAHLLQRHGCLHHPLLLVASSSTRAGDRTGWLLEGDWRGMAGQEERAGHVAALVFVASLTLPLINMQIAAARMLAYGTRLSMIVMSAVCLVNSGSRGALLAAGLGLGACMASGRRGRCSGSGWWRWSCSPFPWVLLALATFELNADKIDVLGPRIDTSSRTASGSTAWSCFKARAAGLRVGGFWTMERTYGVPRPAWLGARQFPQRLCDDPGRGRHHRHRAPAAGDRLHSAALTPWRSETCATSMLRSLSAIPPCMSSETWSRTRSAVRPL